MLTFAGIAWGGSAVVWDNGREVKHELRGFEFAQGACRDLFINHRGDAVGFVKLYRILSSVAEELHVLGVVNDQRAEDRVRSGELLGLSVAIAKPLGPTVTAGDTSIYSRVRPVEVSLVKTPASASAWIATIDGARAPKSSVRAADERQREAAESEQHAELARRQDEAERLRQRQLELLGYWRS